MLRVLLADDHILVRDGIKHLLENSEDIKVVAEASNGIEVISAFKKIRPDVVVLDISMPVMDGLDTCKQLKMLDANCKILILTVHSEEQYAIRLIQAGALGYLSKRMSTNDLQEAVRSVSKGNVYLPAAIKDTVISELFHLRDSSDPLKILSNRELQIFNLVARGKRIKEIAGALCLSQKTIENHLSHILSKLNLKRSIDLVLFAQRNGLIPPS